MARITADQTWYLAGPMSALCILIITKMASGYGLWMRHSYVKVIKEPPRRAREVREMRNKHRKRRRTI